MPDEVETEHAILRTVLYSDLFDYPLTPAEIAHYLIEVPGDPVRVQACLDAPLWLGQLITRVDGYVTLRGREDLVRRRKERSRCSSRLWRKARFFVRILSCMPFVRMICVTGALSMDNSGRRDDVDVMLVTAPNRVWVARVFSLVAVYAGRMAGNTLCPNYLLSEKVLSLERRSLYTAHEFAQMVPLYGFEIYRRMRAANRWVDEFLPNAVRPVKWLPEHRPGLFGRVVKRALERLLEGEWGDRLEAWEMRRKLRKFRARLTCSGGAAILSRDQVKGHFDDHGERVIRAFQRKLEEFHLAGCDCQSAFDHQVTMAPGQTTRDLVSW